MRRLNWQLALVWLATDAFWVGVACLVAGCGSTTDRQTKTVEQEQFKTSPIVIDTPAGQITVHPLVFQHVREQVEVETTKKVIDAPEILPVIQAATGGTPWGSIIGGVVLAATAAFTSKKALDAGRHRNEIISGIERAKDDLPPESWDKLVASLEKEQSADTKQAVKDRVG